ncbi:Protein CHUP1, chloroplastic [Apostasia shenzhenica]|uniref:Protein CHUP1, chloroplastic n=1 Tax=Apostasia shenzhenica TaxID=1088818 RepID=A0A2H9ZRX8_9ASPA|nr:Protein CHUP1, chloroplastic [Apostasia shenzhenica]PKA54144.1 Protein CHUP1, chloroplastic [Apostasia shenzhenica]
MVAGKVKAVMGFQKSPSTPKVEVTRRASSSPSSLKTVGPPSNGKVTVFSRSFGVYFPRSSAQVQPRPPDVAELVRLVEELQEKESRLRTELLEQKLLKETVAVVPFLEKEVAAKNDELDRARQAGQVLETENRALRLEVDALLAKIRELEDEQQQREGRMNEMEAEIEELRRTVSEQQSEQFQGLIDASARSILLKNIRKSPKSADITLNHGISKREPSKERKEEDMETELPHQPRFNREEILKPRLPRVPKPPPMPSASSSDSASSSSSSELAPPIGVRSCIPPPPPPPPPPSAKGGRTGSSSVRRVPEVVEFYHSLMRRDSKRDSGGGLADVPAAANARNMIGEIENRSAHLLAIKTDVETQGDFIRFLIKEVENAAFSYIEDLVAFVKWLDDELSFLVDERAVLKRFEWPEAKADAMREAAFGYCDLRKLEAEASSFRDDPRQPCASTLKKLQNLLEKLEQGVYNLSRVREGAAERYKNFQIPWDWMLDAGFVKYMLCSQSYTSSYGWILLQQMKLASVKLAMKYMRRVTSEIEAIAGGPEEEDLMLQGVRFAFRVHQFAGGFDVETMRAFQELKDKARELQAHKQNHQQQQQNLFCRSMSLTSC